MKKLISGILFMLCIIGLTVLNASAAEVSATVNGIPVPDGGGSITGTGISGSVSFDAATKTLTLETATITVADGQTAINITSGVDTILLKGSNEIKWVDESTQSGNLYAITATALVIKGQSRADSLKITLPGTTSTKAYAINLSAASEIKDCSMDITVLGVTGNSGDCVAVRVAGGDLAVKNASLDLTVGKDGQGTVQATPQGACIYTSHGLTVEGSNIDAGLYSSVGGDYFAAIQGATGISCTNSVIHTEAYAASTAKALKIDFATAINIKNCVLVAKSDMWSLCVGGVMGADIVAENSTVELDGKVLNAKIKSLTGHSAVICTDKDGNVTTYKPGDTIGYIGSYKKILISKAHSHCVCGGNAGTPGHTSHKDETWIMWTSRDSLPTEPGNYCLIGGVTVASDWKIGNDIKLCLNGKTVTFTRGGVKISSGSLVITDCGNTGKMIFAETGVEVQGKCNISLFGGTLKGSSALGDYPVKNGIEVADGVNGVNITLYGGVIEDFGRGILLGKSNTLNINGGTIRNCRSRRFGGGVYAVNGSTVVLAGGKIEGCRASCGGGIDAENASLTLLGGTIENCHASDGGAVYVSRCSVFKMSGTTIRNCTSAGSGGGLHIFETEFEMSGGIITGCSNYYESPQGRLEDVRSVGVDLNKSTLKALGGRIENTVCITYDSRIIGKPSGGTVFTDAVYSGYTAGASENLKYEGNGRMITEYPVYYYEYGGTSLYFNSENCGDVFGDGTLSYDHSTKTVTLKNAVLSGNYTIRAIGTPSDARPVTINLIGNNKIAEATYEKYPSASSVDIIFNGTGSLKTHKLWVWKGTTITVNGGNITIDSRGTDGGAFGRNSSKLVINGGTLTLIDDDMVIEGNTAVTVADDMHVVAGGSANGSDAVEIDDDSYKGKAYARFEKKPSDVTYSPGKGGIGTAVVVKKTYDIDLTLAGALFTRTGYTQTGWATTDGGGKVYDLGGTYTANEAVTLYPVWTINKYTITFDTDGGSAVAPITQDYGTAVTAPADPAKVGYIFAGWDCEIPTSMPAQDLTIKAKWTACDHSGNKNTVTCAKDENCSVCGAVLPALPHTPYPDDRDCSTKVRCMKCGNTVIPAKEHVFAGMWYSDETHHWKYCQNDGCFVREYVWDHEWRDVPAKAATESEDGYTAHRVCTVCGKRDASYRVLGWSLRGDVDRNGKVDSEDAIYLLKNVLLGDKYPIDQSGDMNGDGKADSADAVYLLKHVFFAEKYPLK